MKGRAGASAAAAAVGVVLVGACNGGASNPAPLDERLLDPATCRECHPVHYQQWLGSMHAYAAEDPVFRAMNARGQRETQGELGDFCVRCHAPLAVELGFTRDGLDLDEVPQHLRGVTCFFCHNVVDVTGTHNNPLELAMDGVMRGALADAVDNPVHSSSYSTFVDERTLESSDMCGSCHDIVNQAGVHLERTYKEWLDSFYSERDELSGLPREFVAQTCGQCHMASTEVGPIADAPGVRADRRVHPHDMAGVDLALTDFPDAELGPQLVAIQRQAMERLRSTALCSTVCLGPDGNGGASLDVWLHNESAGHAWPSGANQDRRAWLEMRVESGGKVLLETGAIADEEAVDTFDDPLLWVFRDVMRDDQGNEVHMFWEARSVESSQLAAPAELTPQGDQSTWVSRRFAVDVPVDAIDRVQMRIRLRPIDLAVIDDLVQSGDLDPSIREQIPTYQVEFTQLEWTPSTAQAFAEYGLCVSSSISCGVTRGAGG